MADIADHPSALQAVWMFVMALDAMPSDEVRLAMLDELNDRYCRRCGGKQPTEGRRCQCWNDE